MTAVVTAAGITGKAADSGSGEALKHLVRDKPRAPEGGHPPSGASACHRTNTDSPFGQKPIPLTGGQAYFVSNKRMRAPTAP